MDAWTLSLKVSSTQLGTPSQVEGQKVIKVSLALVLVAEGVSGSDVYSLPEKPGNFERVECGLGQSLAFQAACQNCRT